MFICDTCSLSFLFKCIVSDNDTDSCYGGTIEYYFDKKCTLYAGMSELSDTLSSGCRKFGVGVTSSMQCTTSVDPPVFTQSVLLDYYAGTSCGRRDMFVAYPDNQCTRASSASDRDSKTHCISKFVTNFPYDYKIFR